MAADIQNIAQLLQATLDAQQHRKGTIHDIVYIPFGLLCFVLQIFAPCLWTRNFDVFS